MTVSTSATHSTAVGQSNPHHPQHQRHTMMTSCVGVRKAKHPGHESPTGCGGAGGRGRGGQTMSSQDFNNRLTPRAHPREDVDARSSSAGSSTDGGGSSKENSPNTQQHNPTPTTTSNTNSSSGFLARVYSKIRGSRTRVDRCEKCGQKSDASSKSNNSNASSSASFVSEGPGGRKIYLCEGCRRQSGDKIKGLYEQLWRTLSVHDPPRFVVGGRRGSGGDLILPPSSASSSASKQQQQRGVMRAKSMRTPRPVTAGPDSGYDTATSLDSSCSNGRLSPEPLVAVGVGVECGGGRGVVGGPVAAPQYHQPDLSSSCLQRRDHDLSFPQSALASSIRGNNNKAPTPAFPKDKCDVFRGAADLSRPEPHHSQQHREIQAGPHTRVYTRPPPPYRPRQTPPPYSPPHLSRHPAHTTNTATATTTGYDGYLQIRNPNSDKVKYVFRPREEGQGHSGDEAQAPQAPASHDSAQYEASRTEEDDKLKRCYRCDRLRPIAFRAPFGQGWLCEDCSDDLM